MVRSFTDSSAVTSLAVVAPYVLVGTAHGLDRYELGGETTLHLGRADGLPGERVLGIAADVDSAWVATDGGLGRLDVKRGAFVTLFGGTPPVDVGSIKAIASGPGGGAFVATPKGLFHVDEGGAWRPAGYKRPIAALWVDANANLWIGGPQGAAVRRAGGAVEELTQAPGFGVAAVRLIAPAPDGTPVFIGDDAAGHPRLAFLTGEAFATYRPSPEIRVLAATRRGDDLALFTKDRAFVLTASRQGARILRRDGMHLVPATAGVAKSPYQVLTADIEVPPEPTVAAAAGGDILLGTQTLGIARLSLADTARARLRWLRRLDLVKGATDLSVACVSRDECYLALGATQGWKFDGTQFSPFSPAPGGAPVGSTLAVTRSPDGEVLAVYRQVDDRRLRISRLVSGRFEPMVDVFIETPGGVSALTFARFGPDGLLWLGLQTVDPDGEPRPYGVASVEPSLGAVSYHRQESGLDSGATGVLPLPNDAVDVSFVSADEIWFATESGAARLMGDKLSIYGEPEGLESEILHGIVATAGGMVYVASMRGVGVFDGSAWSFPEALALKTNAIASGADGRLWMGTGQGIAIYDGDQLVRMGPRLGSLDGDVVDLVDDGFGRVFARTALGLLIVSR